MEADLMMSKRGRCELEGKVDDFESYHHTMLSRSALHNFNHALKGIKRCASTSTSTPALKTSDAAITKKEEAPVAQQAPNYPTTWSTSQRPRPGPGSGPRFEQTAMGLQPNP